MVIRKYRDYGINGSAETIISECVRKGYSKGWAGNLDELESIEKICNKFNVVYVCDFNGEWGIRE